MRKIRIKKKKSNTSFSGRVGPSSAKEDSFAQLCSIMKEGFGSLQKLLANLGTGIAVKVTADLTEGQGTHGERSKCEDSVAVSNEEPLFESICKEFSAEEKLGDNVRLELAKLVNTLLSSSPNETD